MDCPKCKYQHNKVLHTIRYKTFDSRVHICIKCLHAFSSKTYIDPEFNHAGYHKFADAQNTLFPEDTESENIESNDQP